MMHGNFTPTQLQWGLCEYVIVHTILGDSPVILWISLGGKPKWLPLKFGYHDVMRTSPICHDTNSDDQKQCKLFPSSQNLDKSCENKAALSADFF